MLTIEERKALRQGNSISCNHSTCTVWHRNRSGYCNGHEPYIPVSRPEGQYEVTNLRTGESHGTYETADEARGCVTYDRLDSWEITFVPTGIRVDAVDLYEGNDDRALQALGYPNASEAE